MKTIPLQRRRYREIARVLRVWLSQRRLLELGVQGPILVTLLVCYISFWGKSCSEELTSELP
jgi:hypothetical protein